MDKKIFEVGDIIEFRQISAGRDDNPPYSMDGQWRIGLLLVYPPKTWKGCPVLYNGKVYTIRLENMRALD